MNRINQLFEAKNKNIVSVYYPAGFPKLNDTLNVMAELQASGVDMIELGIPFSDPMADGEIIQEAATTALENGISLALIFEQLSAMRKTIKIPIILMGYLNPIMQYGFEKFCQDCNRVGVDGVIIPDLPFTVYINEYKKIALRYDIKVVMFVTPETSTERIRLMDKESSSFIYMVSTSGTTGIKDGFSTEQKEYFNRIDSMNLKNPRLIGFGISNKATFESASKYSSGAIIGSYFVRLLKNKSIKDSVKELMEVFQR